DCGTPGDPSFQEFALIERHHRVETGLSPGWLLDDVAEPGATHARADPRLADEGSPIAFNGRHKRFREFQRHLAALDLVERAEQAAVASVGQQHLEHEAVDRLAAE